MDLLTHCESLFPDPGTIHNHLGLRCTEFVEAIVAQWRCQAVGHSCRRDFFADIGQPFDDTCPSPCTLLPALGHMVDREDDVVRRELPHSIVVALLLEQPRGSSRPHCRAHEGVS